MSERFLCIHGHFYQPAQLLDIADAASISLDLWEAQNRFVRLLRAASVDGTSTLIRTLGDRLHVDVEVVATDTHHPEQAR